jgi:hypothetical protein
VEGVGARVEENEKRESELCFVCENDKSYDQLLSIMRTDERHEKNDEISAIFQFPRGF